MTATRESLSAAWSAAIAEWNAARCAEWTPDKESRVRELRARCDAARRAFYGFTVDELQRKGL